MKKLYIPLVIMIVLAAVLFSCAAPAKAPAPAPAPAAPAPATTPAPAPAPSPATTPAPAPTPAPKPAPTPATAVPQYGGTLKVTPQVIHGGPIGWPLEAVGEVGALQQYACEPLLRALWDGTYEPVLAGSWKIAPDKSSITFNLRKGIKFHDGSDFNAKAVKFNLQVFKDAKKATAKNWTSIDVIDDYTFRVNLSKWENTEIGRFGGNLVSQQAYETKGVEWMRNNIVGTGAFKFVSYQRDVSAKFVRSDDYWQKGLPYLFGIEVVYIADKATQVAAIQTGATDVLMAEVGKEFTDLKTMGKFEAISRPSGTMVLVPDSANANSPFADKRVREAVEYAIDREAIVKAKGWGAFKAAYQLPPVGTVAYDASVPGRKYNPEKAKQLLTEAGYSQGFKTKIIVAAVGTDKDVALALQSYLGAVGIQVELEFPTYAKYLEYRYGTWNGLIYQPMAASPNFNGVFTSYIDKASGVWGSLKRPDAFTDLMNESLATPDVEKEKVQKVLTLLYNEVTLIPINDTHSGVVYQKNVHDVGFLTNSAHWFYTTEQAWKSK